MVKSVEEVAKERDAKCEHVCLSLAKYWTHEHCMRMCVERDDRTPIVQYYT